MIKDVELTTLNRIYEDADSIDKELFSEMRTNVLLVMGEHYAKKPRSYGISPSVRGPNSAEDNSNKLRLTKNHSHKVSRIYKSHILDGSPGVTVKPQMDTELQDQKSAELNLSVWKYLHNKHNLKKRFRDLCGDFVDIGECCWKIHWDHDAGRLMGYEPKIDEETGLPVETLTIDEATGETVVDYETDEKKPIFEGEFKFTRIFGPNLLRYASSETMEDNPVWIVRDMVDIETLKHKYKDDPDLVSKIVEERDERYVVFDISKSEYVRTKGQTVIREFYIKPCPQYPKGWYVLATSSVKLEEGELPAGVFPIVWGAFEEFSGTPRGKSIIKVVRPFQFEINRAGSSQALHQITLGDDKVIYQYGSKLTQGALLPGVRGIAYAGGRQPTILPGRTGEQYGGYVASQIDELNQAALVSQILTDEQPQTSDMMSLLFRSASQKRMFKGYIENFEDFMKRSCATVLELAKYYLPDYALIPAIGIGEQVNIEEFRNTFPQETKIEIEEQAETLETKFGRQMTLQNVLQYVGQNLDQKQIGKLLKNLPFANSEDLVSDLTLDEDNVRNDMLAIERGTMPEPNPYSDPTYVVNKLVNRMKKPDYKYLHPQIQQMYQQYKQIHDEMIAEMKRAEEVANQGKIPIEGALVPCDFYVEDPNNPNNLPKRWRAPIAALEWLKTQLEKQGDTDMKLSGMNARALQEIAMQQQQLDQQGAIMPQREQSGGAIRR